MVLKRLSVVAVWAIAAVGVAWILIAFPYGERALPVSALIGFSLLCAFLFQLILSEKEGAVYRMMASISGVLIIALLGLLIPTVIYLY